MFAVVGVWEMDPALREMQLTVLDQIVSGVGQLPGLVKGYWSDAPDPTRSHTFIVFSEREAAEGFAAQVLANAENQARSGVTNVSLEVLTVRATT